MGTALVSSLLHALSPSIHTHRPSHIPEELRPLPLEVRRGNHLAAARWSLGHLLSSVLTTEVRETTSHHARREQTMVSVDVLGQFARKQDAQAWLSAKWMEYCRAAPRC